MSRRMAHSYPASITYLSFDKKSSVCNLSPLRILRVTRDTRYLNLFSVCFSIEVKSRVKGTDTVTVTKNEILPALNKPEDFFLALVEVDGEETHTVYLKKPFRETPDFAARGVIYSIEELKNGAEIMFRTV